MKVVLTIVDTAGIQNYIFGSNRLRENIGASYLVVQATRMWVYEELDKLGKHNVAQPKAGEIDRRIDPSVNLEDDELTAELIYSGGGNTTILFRCPNEGDPLAVAKEFTWKLSIRILTEAPGLDIVITHSEPFDWDPKVKDLYGRVKKLRDTELAQKKRTRRATLTPMLGLGVTAECAATGLVAAERSRGLEPEFRLVSREIIAKLENKDSAQRRLRKMIREIDPQDEFRFSDELDHLGRTGGEESYIAVVHIDGNDMGKLFSECGQNASNNREYIKRVSEFSDGVDQASRKAIVAVFSKLRSCIESPKENAMDQRPAWTVKEVVPSCVPKEKLDRAQQKRFDLFRKNEDDDDGDGNEVRKAKEKPCWPVRPIVYGGDEVTFVCNGQLGLSLAEIYMKEFTKLTESLPFGPIHTGAGVCIVKVHYPFRRAYELSESLMKSAKRFLGEHKRRASAIDWHVSATGLSGGLSQIRESEYAVTEGRLTMRPVWLRHDSDWRTLANFNRLVALFNYDETWAGRRNKLKILREVLRGGAERVGEYLHNSRVKLPVLDDSQPDLQDKAWVGDSRDKKRHCVYFDALEAMDIHTLLEDVTHGNDNQHS